MKKFKLLKLHWSLILSIFLLVLFLAPSANVLANWDSFTKGINIGGTTITSSLGNATASVSNSVTSVSNGIVSGWNSQE